MGSFNVTSLARRFLYSCAAVGVCCFDNFFRAAVCAALRGLSVEASGWYAAAVAY